MAIFTYLYLVHQHLGPLRGCSCHAHRRHAGPWSQSRFLLRWVGSQSLRPVIPPCEPGRFPIFSQWMSFHFLVFMTLHRVESFRYDILQSGLDFFPKHFPLRRFGSKSQGVSSQHPLVGVQIRRQGTDGCGAQKALWEHRPLCCKGTREAPSSWQYQWSWCEELQGHQHLENCITFFFGKLQTYEFV